MGGNATVTEISFNISSSYFAGHAHRLNTKRFRRWRKCVLSFRLKSLLQFSSRRYQSMFSFFPQTELCETRLQESTRWFSLWIVGGKVLIHMTGRSGALTGKFVFHRCGDEDSRSPSLGSCLLFFFLRFRSCGNVDSRFHLPAQTCYCFFAYFVSVVHRQCQSAASHSPPHCWNLLLLFLLWILFLYVVFASLILEKVVVLIDFV